MKMPLLLLAGALLASFDVGVVVAQEKPYMRIAEIDVDPAQLARYREFLTEEIEASVRIEPGVVSLNAVAEKDNPARIVVFEVYASVEAYRAHIETPHFLKYKNGTRDMVKSLKLIDVDPLAMKSKPLPVHERPR
jgi:quinol monooxygenase YgiN